MGGTAGHAQATSQAPQNLAPPDGGAVRVRPVAAGDPDRLRRMLSRLSPETVYMRLHTPRVPEWAPGYLGDADNRGGYSLVAVVGEEILGHAMYARPERGEAEVAVLVEDGWQARGIGRLLLQEIAEEARRRGVEVFTCTALGENRRVHGLANAVFAEIAHEVKDGMRSVRAPLRALRPKSGRKVVGRRRTAHGETGKQDDHA